MDNGEEAISDSAEQEALRSQGRKVHIESAATGIVLTVLFLLILGNVRCGGEGRESNPPGTLRFPDWF